MQLLECGLLPRSFIPPADVKAARDVIRYRTKLTESRTSELQRLGNVLQDVGIKFDSVASKLATLSARAMVEALIDGEPARRYWPIWPRAGCGPGFRIWRGHWRPLWRSPCVDVPAAPRAPGPLGGHDRQARHPGSRR